ncbi:MAG: hypothetical protein AAFV93_17075 [Chloroflexota bacterium]
MLLRQIGAICDSLEHFWEEVVMKRYTGIGLVILYLVALLVVEFNRQGMLPANLAELVPETHFWAVEIAFTALLLTEVVSLIFALTHSFSRSIGIQFQLLSLILLRDVFKQFTYFPEPLTWQPISERIGLIGVDALAALAIFIILQIYYRNQKSFAITDDEQEQENFINSKKAIALGLLVTFIVIGIDDSIRALSGGETYPFFDTFFTLLIFTDVLMVLLSMQYSHSYAVTFRNFGYALVTVLIRVSLVAPSPINGLVGVSTALFALGIALIYKTYGESELMEPNMAPELKPSRGKPKPVSKEADAQVSDVPTLEPGVGD